MKTQSLLVGLLVSTSAFAARPANRYSERSVAREFAQRHYGSMGKVTIARRPLLKTGSVNPFSAWGVKLDDKRQAEAVMVQGGVGGYTAYGMADVFKIAAPKGNQTVNLGSTFTNTVIIRTSRKATVEATQNLTLKAEGTTARTRSVALTAAWPPGRVPGRVYPMIFPGPSPSMNAQATIRSKAGKTEANMTFQRYVIMANGPQ